MPYMCKKVGDKWKVHKQSEDGKWSVLSSSGDHSSKGACNKQVRALYANENVKNELDVRINGIIGVDVTEEYVDFQMWASGYEEKEREDEDKETCYVHVSSKGGDYPVALNIYNKLKSCGRKITTCAEGVVASAGAVILLAGDEIEAASNSVIMFHMPKLISSEAMSADELQKKSEDLRAFEASLVATCKQRMGKNEEEIRAFLGEEKYLTPKEAKKMNLIDRIIPFVRKKKLDVSNLVGATDEIVAFAKDVNMEVDAMALKDVCSQLEIKVEDSATDEQITSTLVELVMNLRKEVETLKIQLPKQKITLPTGIVNMIKRSREAELNALVSDGRITPVVAKELSSIFNNDTTLASCIDEAGNVADNFDKTIDALKKNEKVINFGGSSGTQQLPKFGDNDNPLIRDAERRAKK